MLGRPSTESLRPWRVRCCAVLGWTVLLVAPPLKAQSPSVSPDQPVYWQQRVMFIPYQLNPQAAGAKEIAEVELLLAKGSPANWQVLQSAKPNVRGFSYFAPEDGTYWFSLQHRDKKHRILGPATPQPQLQMVIDTTRPVAQISATVEQTGSVLVHFDVRDPNLDAGSLLLQASAGGDWVTLAVEQTTIRQNDRLQGSTHWHVPASGSDFQVRLQVADLAKNRFEATTAVELAGPELEMSRGLSSPPSSSSLPKETPSPTRDPFRFEAEPIERKPAPAADVVPVRPAQSWPSDNQLPRVEPPAVQQKTGDDFTAPPIINPYATASQERNPQRRTEARFALDESTPAGASPAQRNLAAGLRPDPQQGGQLPRGGVAVDVTGPQSDWQSDVAHRGAPMVVNSATFDIEYDLEAVGPWGISSVELWGTTDGGQTWQSFGTDADNRSPFRAAVPGAGYYGFRIVVHGADGSTSTRPQPGMQPELFVSVDLQPPRAELLSAEVGEGNQKDQLRLTWQAADDNLEPRPIGLYYSSGPHGPWTTISTGLENTGEYLWRLERYMPDRFYIRLEVRDTAGNVTHYISPEPLVMLRAQPRGRLLDVRPVTEVPTVR